MTQEPKHNTFTEELSAHITELKFPTLWERLTPDAMLMVESIEPLERRDYIESILKRHKFFIDVPFGDARFVVRSLNLNQDFVNFVILFQ